MPDLVAFELAGKQHSAEHVARKLADGQSWSVNGFPAKHTVQGVWLAQRTENNVTVSIVARSNNSESLLVSVEASAEYGIGMGLGAIVVHTSPLIAGPTAFFLGAGWWSLACAVGAYFVGMYLLLLALQRRARKYQPTEERLHSETIGHIERLYSGQCQRIADFEESESFKDRVRQLTVSVEMITESLDKFERSAAAGDEVGKLIHLQSCHHVFDMERLESGSDAMLRWKECTKGDVRVRAGLNMN